MAPGVELGERLDLRRTAHRRSRYHLACDMLAHAFACGDSAHELYAVHQTVQVFSPTVVAFVEIMKIDIGPFTGIGGFEPHHPGRIVGMGLEYRPGEMFMIFRDPLQ